MLDEEVERFFEWGSGFDVAGLDGAAGGGELDEFEGMGRDADDAAFCAGLVAAAAGALEEAGDAFGAADLEDAVDGGEVDAEVEGAGADDALEPAGGEEFFDLSADAFFERAVVEGDGADPIGAGAHEGLEPDFGLGAGVGEEEAGVGGVDCGADFVGEVGADVAGPWVAADVFGEEAADGDGFCLV